jgi:hypothetical protein
MRTVGAQWCLFILEKRSDQAFCTGFSGIADSVVRILNVCYDDYAALARFQKMANATLGEPAV